MSTAPRFADHVPTFHELDVVALRSLVSTDDGTIEPGAIGAIVHGHAGTDAYEVEFVEPFATVVTLRGSDLVLIA